VTIAGAADRKPGDPAAVRVDAIMLLQGATDGGGDRERRVGEPNTGGEATVR
jgi:hypothetical protein